MGKDFSAAFLFAQAWFDRADAALGCDLVSVCFNGPDVEATKTENAQPGISPAQRRSTGGAQMANSHQFILAADDVLKCAKQAPGAKGDVEKRTELQGLQKRLETRMKRSDLMPSRNYLNPYV